MVKLVNKTDKLIAFEISTVAGVPAKKYRVKPGESCEVPKGYCTKREGRSILDGLAPGLEPFVAPKAAPSGKKPGYKSEAK